jgi:hypothetical protein
MRLARHVGDDFPSGGRPLGDLTIKQEQQTEIASLTGALSNRIKPLTAACVLCSQKGVRLETRPAVSGEFDMTATYAKS